MLEESSLWQSSASTAPGTLRWKSPELMSGIQKTVTPESDMYAYGMTSLEVFTENIPFSQYTNDCQVLFAVQMRGEIPLRPENPRYLMDENIWRLWQGCWNKDTSKRPSASDVLNIFAQTASGVNRVSTFPLDHTMSWQDVIFDGMNAQVSMQMHPDTDLSHLAADEHSGRSVTIGTQWNFSNDENLPYTKWSMEDLCPTVHYLMPTVHQFC